MDSKLYVPGVMYCAKCNFRVVRTNLHVYSGTTSAGDNKTEPCPNGCGPLWPVTWQKEAKELAETVEKQFETIQSLQAENEKLKKLYIKLTNSDTVVNEHNEFVGYTATHEILNEFDKIITGD